MSNEYHGFFDENTPPMEPLRPIKNPEPSPIVPLDTTEPLDAILQDITAFKQQEAAFSALLSKTSAIDHEEEAEAANALFALVFVAEPLRPFGDMVKEKKHYALLQEKFKAIIIEMKTLALMHFEIVKKFNRDIDTNYYSIEKTTEQIKQDLQTAVENINLQRGILSNASRDLSILKDAMQTAENRMKHYVDSGGPHNLSGAEWAVWKKNREILTNGSTYQFNYTFFRINLVDKLAIRFGIYMKETTTQYVQQLWRAFDGARE